MSGDAALVAIVREAFARAGLGAPPERAVVVSVERQRLYLLDRGQVAAEFPVSTSALGVGGAEGSNRTPPGVHRIREMIGAGNEVGTVYVDRQPTGVTWRGEASTNDMILTRILTLDGLEPGVNQGAGVDSLARYIYIHGTNQEDKLGTPASHGCIRMANGDVIDLFDRLKPGDLVVVA